MGKTLIQQARGHGSLTYRASRKAYNVKPSYLQNLEGEFELVKFITSAGHSAPIAKFKQTKGNLIFFNQAAKGLYQGQKININGTEEGDVTMLGNLENGARIFNIENRPKDGGKFVRTGGNSAVIINKNEEKKIVVILMPSKKEKEFSFDCRATVGTIAGHGRLDKPWLKAGRKFYLMKARNKLWPRTSAIKMNALDHPFGSGRGKRIKSKIAKNNAPPGAKVGHLHPRRTGRRKK